MCGSLSLWNINEREKNQQREKRSLDLAVETHFGGEVSTIVYHFLVEFALYALCNDRASTLFNAISNYSVLYVYFVE